MSVEGPKLVPVTYDEFLKTLKQVSQGIAPNIDLIKKALTSVFNSPEMLNLAQTMIRQSQLQFGKQANSALELNPQNAPAAIARDAVNLGANFKAHPELKNYLGAIQNIIQNVINNNPSQTNSLLTSFDKHNTQGEQAFKQLKNELENKLKHKFAPRPTSSPKPRPE